MALLEYQIKSSKRKIYVELISGRTAVISCPAAFITEDKKDNKIISISYEEDVKFTVGQELVFKLENITSSFIIDEILKNEKPGRYYITCCERTLSTYFLLPFISKNRKENKKWWKVEDFIVNAYLKNDSTLAVVVRYFPTSEFKEFEDKLKNHPNYIGFEDPNHYIVTYFFHIQDIYSKDVELFKQGKYSKMHHSSKTKIISFHEALIGGDTWNILYSAPERKKKLEEEFGTSLPDDMDLLSKPDLNKEDYDKNYSKSKV